MTSCIFPDDLTCVKVDRPANEIGNFVQFCHILGSYSDKTFHFLGAPTSRFVLTDEADAVDQMNQDKWASQHPGEKAHRHCSLHCAVLGAFPTCDHGEEVDQIDVATHHNVIVQILQVEPPILLNRRFVFGFCQLLYPINSDLF